MYCTPFLSPYVLWWLFPITCIVQYRVCIVRVSKVYPRVANAFSIHFDTPSIRNRGFGPGLSAVYRALDTGPNVSNMMYPRMYRYLYRYSIAYVSYLDRDA